MPKNESERPLTPEEMRWRAAAWDPEKARRNQKLQYTVLGFWIAATVAWVILTACGVETIGWWGIPCCCAAISTVSQALSTTNASREAENRGATFEVRSSRKTR